MGLLDNFTIDQARQQKWQLPQSTQDAWTSNAGVAPTDPSQLYFRGQLHNSLRPMKDPMAGYEWARQAFDEPGIAGQANPQFYGWYQQPEGYQAPEPDPGIYPPGQNYRPPQDAGLYQNRFNQGDTGISGQNVQYPGGNEWFPNSFGGRSPFQFMPLMQQGLLQPSQPGMVSPQQRNIPILGNPEDPYMMELRRQQQSLLSSEPTNNREYDSGPFGY